MNVKIKLKLVFLSARAMKQTKMIAHHFLDYHLDRALRHAMADEENCLCCLEIKYFKFVIKLTTSNLTLQFDGIRLKTSLVMIMRSYYLS